MAQFWILRKVMRKYAFILMVLTAGSAAAQTTGTTSIQPGPPSNPNQAEITFTKSEHDFGTVKRGAPMTCKFEFTNTGKEDLIISNCRAGCECTKVSCLKEPVKSGKKGYIEVHYDSTRVGKFGKEVMVHSNAKKPMTFLIIKGNVEPVEEPAPGGDIKAPPIKDPEK